ncbi:MULTISPECIES: type VI secretion system Vgr family protein [Acidiphilium]|uniref:Type VI secretion system secreted protein VgrG n=1 Tax=Acidiphilium rubrum TaxID=526 RepID=A0A8G2CMX6_ACIRU|nr:MULTISPECIES: type VI secretion system tip protein TssI/VgrG [Acidiphilium]SIR33196.1 type VI secretion system secreted protein VgrG [Acidiphilium rubrum]
MDVLTDLLEIQTPLPPDSFKATGVLGGCDLSQPFAYTVTLRTGLSIIQVDQLLHQPVTITIAQGGPHLCYLNGLVVSITQMPSTSTGSTLLASQSYWDYEIVIVPKLHFLEQTRDCRFFENKSSLDIAQQILPEFGVTDVEYRINGNPPSRPYTVMFNETYLGFLNRILAEDGLFYFFEHSDGKHTLVIGNSNAAFKTLPASPLMFSSLSGIEASVHTWHRADATTLGTSTMGDYNPTTASTAIKGDEPTILTAPGVANRTHYHWPSWAPDPGTAQTIAKRHMQAHEARAQVYEGSATIPDLYVGGQITLTGDPTADGGASDYVLISVALAISDQGGAMTNARDPGITLSLTAIPAKTPWQPIPLPKPAMAGFYSATVIGPQGEEIYTDDLGRIKVQFPWDHRGETTSSGSFWLRVVQPWSGGGWGAQFIPRIGQEVAVTFLEGDIDRPVAVGALYNSTNTPIFPASDKNKSGFRSRSTKGGGAADYNEISFDDTMGSEILLFHAQKDHVIEVENDQTMTVDANRTVTVKKNEAITVQGTQTVKVTKAVLYESDTSITLKVGDSTIVMDHTSITLKSLMIKIEAESLLQTDGKIAQHKAGTLMIQNAPIIKVN